MTEESSYRIIRDYGKIRWFSFAYKVEKKTYGNWRCLNFACTYSGARRYIRKDKREIRRSARKLAREEKRSKARGGSTIIYEETG